MRSSLNKLLKPDNVLLCVVSWWIGTSNWPHAVQSNVLWRSCSISGEGIDSQVAQISCDRNIVSGVCNTAVHVWNVVAECFDWTRHLIGEMSLWEDENSVSVSNGSVFVDVLVVNVCIDANVGTGWKKNCSNENLWRRKVSLSVLPAGKVSLIAVT